MKASVLRVFLTGGLLSLLALSCDNYGRSVDRGAEGRKVRTKSLASGKEIQVLSVRKAAGGNGEPSLILEYLTDLQIEDHVKLQDEVEEVWVEFQVDAETAGAKVATIWANDRNHSSSGFVFRRNSEGTWENTSGFVPSSKGTTPNQTANFRTLRSGKQIRVLGTTRTSFGSAEEYLALDYATELKSTDDRAFEMEVEEIWNDFRQDVEEAAVSMAVVETLDPNTRQPTGFVFRRDSRGEWRRERF